MLKPFLRKLKIERIEQKCISCGVCVEVCSSGVMHQKINNIWK
ncbi:4Fe-4S binding protein [Flammeovirga sp. OC4]